MLPLHRTRLHDSHCHICLATSKEAHQSATGLREPKDTSDVTSAPTSVMLPQSCGRYIVLCGTHPQLDWKLVCSFAALPTAGHSTAAVTDEEEEDTTLPVTVLCGFGLHPWFAPAKKSANMTPPVVNRSCCSPQGSMPQWRDSSTASLTYSMEEALEELESHLLLNPNAFVGEIGLDKLRGPPQEIQVEAFLAQVRLAAKYCRPVSIHCVRHYGLLLELLQSLTAEEVPPAFILHGFTGSHSIAKSLLNLKNKKCVDNTAGGVVRVKERIYFGVGPRTSFAVKGFEDQTLPLLLEQKRVLIETDAYYSAFLSTHDRVGVAMNEVGDAVVKAGGLALNAEEHSTSLISVVERLHGKMAQARTSEIPPLEANCSAGSMVVDRAALYHRLHSTFLNAFASVLEA